MATDLIVILETASNLNVTMDGNNDIHLDPSPYGDVTEEAIVDALGYTPADDADVSELKADLNKWVRLDGVTIKDGTALNPLITDFGNGAWFISNGTPTFTNYQDFKWFDLPVKSATTYYFDGVFRWIYSLDDDNNVVEYKNDGSSSFAVGTDAVSMRVTYNKNRYPNGLNVAVKGTPTNTEYNIPANVHVPDIEKNLKIAVNDLPKYKCVTGNIGTGEYLQLPDTRTNLRKGERIVFEADITSFTAIRIGMNNLESELYDSRQRNMVVIDTTNLSYYTNINATPVVVAHGLTISDNIQLIWEELGDAKLKFTVISGGNSFTHEFAFIRQLSNWVFVKADNAVLTDCKLTWTCKDLAKKIWVFGDSYVSYSQSRWTYYLETFGYSNNCLIDGYPGQGSVDMRVSYSNLLHFNIPKIAVMCTGMNDGSDDELAPNGNWTSERDYFLQYCADNNVTPVFGTIPSVPTINHEKKNEWIRSSGYRYIDFAKAVGSTPSGSWYSGMLAQDGVHPTDKGAKALFARALLDLPEIMVDNF